MSGKEHHDAVPSATGFHGKALNDCFLHDKDRLPHHEAIAILRQNLPVIAGEEVVPLHNALGRILSKNITANRNIPSTDNSAVDGFAFKHSDLVGRDEPFSIGPRIVAGDITPHKIRDGEAARIFTGAVMPMGADTIAMQEDCKAENGKVHVPKGLKRGANCRKSGEDVQEEATIAGRGLRLRPQDLAAIASNGMAETDVFRRLRVTLFSSGNELVEPGQKARRGEVFDANRTMLRALLAPLPVIVTDGGILPDEAAAVEEALLAASRNSDILLTSAGASRGDEDHMIATLDRHGTRHMWQLAIKPGRPMTFGTLGQSAWFGLPGNPVASFVCFLLYVQPSILRLGGGQWLEPKRFTVPAGFEIKNKKPDRREFLRATLITDPAGNNSVLKYPRDGSGLISGLREANGLVELPEETGSVEYGEPVSFIPFSQFGIYE